MHDGKENELSTPPPPPGDKHSVNFVLGGTRKFNNTYELVAMSAVKNGHEDLGS